MAKGKSKEWQVVWREVNELTPYAKNARKNDKAVPYLVNSIKRFGFKVPLVIDTDGTIVCGHTRLKAALTAGLARVPCVVADDLTPAELKAFRLADNKVAEIAEWDEELLADEMDGLEEELGQSMDDFGFGDLADDEEKEKVDKGALAKRFVAPPFSVLLGFKGDWLKRKRVWKEVIASHGESREGKLADKDTLMGKMNNGVSLFDPVLAECCCKWFCPTGGKIFDPFAGDTFKSLVFGLCGFKFAGIELRKEQVAENAKVLNRFKELDVRYICDDGQNVAKHFKTASQDMLFSCPPYFDLEVYSDNPKDASNQKNYAAFLEILRNAFTDAVKCLKDDRFAVVVVGDIRDKRGFYYDFPADVKRIFKEAGLPLYNELTMVDPIGTAAQRASNSMKNRKVVKIHQNVLCFYKGDPANIKKNFPAIEYDTSEIEQYAQAEETEDGEGDEVEL